MGKNFFALILFLFFGIARAQIYFPKKYCSLYAEVDQAMTNIRFIERDKDSWGGHAGSWDNSYSTDQRNWGKISLIPEIGFKRGYPNNVHWMFGFFYNNLQFTTSIITSTVRTHNYGSPGSSYFDGDKFYEKGNIYFFGTTLGGGYSLRRQNITIDFEGGFKILTLLINSRLSRTTIDSTNYHIYGWSPNGEWGLRGDPNGSLRYNTSYCGFARASISHYFTPHWIVSTGLQYTQSIYLLQVGTQSSVYDLRLGILQISAFAGLSYQF